eukprot:Amastigsp_a841567_286.p3 type:complete len:212 gc:universal Amastigsp_a841567_286:706-71(-)
MGDVTPVFMLRGSLLACRTVAPTAAIAPLLQIANGQASQRPSVFAMQTRSITHPGKRKKVLDRAKGFVGRSKNILGAASRRTNKAAQYSYRDRRTKKREFRGLWIAAVNAGVREHGIKYSEFMFALQQANVVLNRKVLSELAITEPRSFAKVVDFVKPLVFAKREDDLARSLRMTKATGVVSIEPRTYTMTDVVSALRAGAAATVAAESAK